MPFDWREYLSLAEFLTDKVGRYSEEAANRCAVSRAYFSAFCYARGYAREKYRFEPTYTPDDHKNLKKFFRDVGMVPIARRLDHLRKWRNNCDYEDIVDNHGDISKNAIRVAQAVFKDLN